jgi:hypothetical protein
MLAERTAKFTFRAGPRREFDPAEAGMALRTDDVASFHGATLCRTTMTVPRRRQRPKMKVEVMINGGGRQAWRYGNAARVPIPGTAFWTPQASRIASCFFPAPGQGAFLSRSNFDPAGR